MRSSGGGAIRRVGGGARRVARRAGSIMRPNVPRALGAGAGAGALAMYEGREGGSELSVAGFDGALVLGALAVLFAPQGRLGKHLQDAGLGVFAVGVNRSVARKSVRVGEEDDYQ